ncbi:MAG: hypothetical protein ABL949_13480 [Fimbriimonadaceae bacterium]
MKQVLIAVLALTLVGSAFSQTKTTQAKGKPSTTHKSATSMPTKMVWVTKTGTKYHKMKNCPGLKNAKDVEQISISAAYKRNLKICDHCRENKKPTAKKMGGSGG